MLTRSSRKSSVTEGEFQSYLDEVNINILNRISTCIKCDITNWDDQVSLFEHAMNVYGCIDIVVCLHTFLHPTFSYNFPDPKRRHPRKPRLPIAHHGHQHRKATEAQPKNT